LRLRLGVAPASAWLGMLPALAGGPSIAPLGVRRRRDHAQGRDDERRSY
jgi:hypothetical protein